MEDDPIIFVLRYGSYKHYFTSKWRSLGVLCSGLWLGQITILFVTGAGLSVIKQGWDNFSGSSLLKEIAPLLWYLIATPRGLPKEFVQKELEFRWKLFPEKKEEPK